MQIFVEDEELEQTERLATQVLEAHQASQQGREQEGEAVERQPVEGQLREEEPVQAAQVGQAVHPHREPSDSSIESSFGSPVWSSLFSSSPVQSQDLGPAASVAAATCASAAAAGAWGQPATAGPGVWPSGTVAAEAWGQPATADLGAAVAGDSSTSASAVTGTWAWACDWPSYWQKRMTLKYFCF